MDNETCTWQTYRLFPKDLFEDRSWLETGGHPSYVLEQYIRVQREMVIQYWLKRNNIQVNWIFQMQPLPYPGRVDSDLLVRIPYLIPIILLISFNFAFVNSVRYIVNEKEKQLKDAMKIMGLTNWMHRLCWFIRSTAMLFIPITIITGLFVVSFHFLYFFYSFFQILWKHSLHVFSLIFR